MASAISSAPSSTKSPTANRTASTVPSTGAATVCSIFIASMIISGSPRRTVSPASTNSWVTRPGIGAVSRPAPGSSPSRAASGSISASRQFSPARNTRGFSTVIEHGGAAAHAVEHDRQAAVGPPLASGARSSRSPTLQQPIPGLELWR